MFYRVLIYLSNKTVLGKNPEYIYTDQLLVIFQDLSRGVILTVQGSSILFHDESADIVINVLKELIELFYLKDLCLVKQAKVLVKETLNGVLDDSLILPLVILGLLMFYFFYQLLFKNHLLSLLLSFGLSRLYLRLKPFNNGLEAVCVLELSKVLEVSHTSDLIHQYRICDYLILEDVIEEQAPHKVKGEIASDPRTVFFGRAHMSFNQVLRYVYKLLEVAWLLGGHNLLDEFLEDSIELVYLVSAQDFLVVEGGSPRV